MLVYAENKPRKKAKAPTRSRMSFAHHLPHYSPRLVFSLGIVQLVCGVALVFLNLVLLRIDRDKALSWSISLPQYLDSVVPDQLRVIWLGAWIAASGFITLFVSFRPYGNCPIYVLLLSSLFTVAITGTFAILLSNHVIQNSVLIAMLNHRDITSSIDIASTDHVTAIRLSHSNFAHFHNENQHQKQQQQQQQQSPLPEQYQSNPVLFFNLIMLCFCTVAFVISIVSFSIVSHHLCSCTTVFDGKLFPTEYHIYDAGTWSRKERIVQWVMQQQQSQQSLSDQVADHLPVLQCSSSATSLAQPSSNTNSTEMRDAANRGKKHLAAQLQVSSASNSVNLSLYGT